MKKRYLIMFLALPFLVLSCAQENLQTESTGKTISVTATLAAETDTPNTKISLEQDVLNIKLEWEEGDCIALCIVADQQAYTQKVDVVIDKENKKNASFKFTLPDDPKITKFDLYGMYGGNGFQENSTLVILPDNPVADTEEGIRKDMVLTFTQTDIDASSPSLSVNFSHLGSVFRILVSNTDATNFDVISEVKKAVLAPKSPGDFLGLHINAGKGDGRYNVKTETFSGTNRSVTEFSFELPLPVDLKPGKSQEFWAWIIPDGTGWPELELKLVDASYKVLYTTSNFKESKTSPPTFGKAYHFFADYDNDALTFSDLIRGKFTDPRDGNVYKTVEIIDKNSKKWIIMAENLRYLPKVVGPDEGDSEDAHYYVYGFEGTNVDAAKIYKVGEICHYQTYGVLYNWPAAMIACPDGWSLPSYDEWGNIFLAFTTFYTQAGPYFKAIGTKEDGDGLWKASDKATKATNSSGFTVLPAGNRTSGKFEYLEERGAFYSSSLDGSNKGGYHRFVYDVNGVTRNYCARTTALSVRCVKD
ncbi:MAG: hypothetical protein GX877_06285 [Bacteroidales bacterium]|nr:hypothetical protein [Bacteroidales bacterium]